MSNEFEEEVVTDLEAGRKETLAKLESARKETEEAVSKILETGLKQAESVKRQVIGAAELDARNIQLKALEVAVNNAFGVAAKEISQTKGASYERAMVRLIQEGIDVIGANARVQCSSADRRVVLSALGKVEGRVSLGDVPVETIGGVVLTTPDGSVRFDNTFEARLERMRPTLRKDVAAILTGG